MGSKVLHFASMCIEAMFKKRKKRRNRKLDTIMAKVKCQLSMLVLHGEFGVSVVIVTIYKHLSFCKRIILEICPILKRENTGGEVMIIFHTGCICIFNKQLPYNISLS